MNRKARRRINRKVIALATAIILALVLLEIYTHNYVQIRHLPTLTEEQALKSIPYYHNFTYTFSSDGARWLVVFQGKKPGPSTNAALVYLFKVEQNESLLTQSTDLLILGIHPTAGDLTGYFWARIADDGIIYESNDTVVQIEYDLQVTGTFHIDLGLQVRVYQETILGLVPKEEIEIPVNATLSY